MDLTAEELMSALMFAAFRTVFLNLRETCTNKLIRTFHEYESNEAA